MGQWLQYRSKYLNILLEMEGWAYATKCSICSTTAADIKCSDCFGPNIFCKKCSLDIHKRSPFHRLLRWTGKHYTPTSLYSLGFLLCLAHNGEPCPKTVEVCSYSIVAPLLCSYSFQGVKAAKARASGKRRTTGRTTAPSSIQEIEEEDLEADTLGISQQLPTPRETPQPEIESQTPAISDTLFDFVDMSLDLGNSDAHRTRTGIAGNPLMTVVDSQGVFEMEVLFCACSDSRSRDEQLLMAGLFPATFKQIETLFTFAVLDNFLADNLECKTTAQQYFSKLQSMTSNLFPNYVPVSQLLHRCSRLTYFLRIDTNNY
jgi:hypothetical protein